MVILASLNVFGGYVVTERMLQMFKPRATPAPQGRDAAEVTATHPATLVNHRLPCDRHLLHHGLALPQPSEDGSPGQPGLGAGNADLAGRDLPCSGFVSWWISSLGVGIGAAIGIYSARAVKMTAMPQMVALFNGAGGGAAALVAAAEFLRLLDASAGATLPFDQTFTIVLSSSHRRGQLLRQHHRLSEAARADDGPADHLSRAADRQRDHRARDSGQRGWQ